MKKGRRVIAKNLLKIMDENPQQLIDDKTEFEFEEIPGNVKLVDGVAAGTDFFGFEFVTGPYAKKTLYCECLRDYETGRLYSWTYNTDVNSDGFLFNWKNREENQGDHVPELDGKILTLKG